MSERSTSMPDACRAPDQDLRARAFSPAILKLDSQAPSPLPRALLWTLTALVGCALIGAFIGRLDMIAVAHGRLVPQSFLKIVQPAEAGVVRELLVQEGDVVEAGQVLVRMDPRLSDVDVGHRARAAPSAPTAIAAHRCGVLRRIRSFRGRVIRRSCSRRSAAQYRARRQSHLDALAPKKPRQRTGPVMTFRSRRRRKTKLARSLPMHREQAEGWDTLAKEGFAGKLLALERKRQWLEAEQELKAQNAQVESLRATIAQIGASDSTIAVDLPPRRCWTSAAEAQADLERLAQESKRQSVRQDQLELRAPAAGVIKELATHTAGTVVQPGTVLMTVVPRSEAVQAEVWIDQVDAGFVREQLPAQVKVATFPFQKYGMVGGRVRHLSPDASDAPTGLPGAEPRTPFGGTSGYRALIALDSSHLDRDGQRLDLAPGMQVSAEIHLGTRSVMEYLLSPVQKTVLEAGRER